MGDLGRRTFLKGAGIAALSAARVLQTGKAHARTVPNSVGTNKPKLKAPPGARLREALSPL
ncbi:MAG TPA: twin-arginine translocation signal domain-containing protein [Micropepsaceae bacterium]|nr:twin-arginine translocation signal domain-containing protein [Micropepsaceae bacterium]